MTINIIIPAYNPDIKLYKIVSEIFENKQLNMEKRLRIIIVNDGSDSQCRKIFYKCKCMGCEILEHKRNLGKGRGIKTALKYIEKTRKKNNQSYVVIIDADGQHKVKDMERLIEKLKENTDSLVIGVRKFKGNIPFRSRFGNIITMQIFKFVTGKKVNDTQTGLRGFSTNYIPFMINIPGDRYEYEMEVLLKAVKNKISIEEVNIECIYEENNKSSHFRPLKDSIKIYKEILKFSCSSLICFLVDYLLFLLFYKISENIVASNICARIISGGINFTLNKNYIFKTKGNVKNQLINYLFLAVSILIINTLLLNYLFTFTNIKIYIVKVLVEITMFIFNYFIQKKVVFTY